MRAPTGRQAGRRRGALVMATAIIVGAPGLAFWAAPASGGGADAAGLAGINTDATSAAAQIIAYTPNIVPVGNAAKGDFLQASLPYAESSASTGPSTAGIASPAWPGSVAATAGNALQTFSPNIPVALVHALNDPAVARSAYPAQLSAGSSGSFPPGSTAAGVATSTTESGPSSSTSHAVLTDTSPLGSGAPASTLVKAVQRLMNAQARADGTVARNAAKVPILDIASATSDTEVSVGASSVTTTATTHVGHISIAGVIDIDGISSTATAGSDGTTGKTDGDLNVGHVTVAGLEAKIGPDGIALAGKGLTGLPNLVALANTALTALQASGITIKTVAADGTVTDNQATEQSGAVEVIFNDPDIPNLGALLPQVPLPLPSSVGLEVDLGSSKASAAATPLPSDVATTPTTATTTPVTAPSGGAPGIGPVTLPSGPTVGSTVPPGSEPVVAVPQASVLGLPVKAAWVVLAFLLSLLAAGPLLAYANWQLLRGRSS